MVFIGIGSYVFNYLCARWCMKYIKKELKYDYGTIVLMITPYSLFPFVGGLISLGVGIVLILENNSFNLNFDKIVDRIFFLK